MVLFEKEKVQKTIYLITWNQVLNKKQADPKYICNIDWIFKVLIFHF